MSINEQSFLENLQASDHHRKRRFLILGSGVTMIIVIFVWLGVSVFFGGSSEKKVAFKEPDFSLWQTMRGGSMLLAQMTTDQFHSISTVFGREKSYVITPASADTK